MFSSGLSHNVHVCARVVRVRLIKSMVSIFAVNVSHVNNQNLKTTIPKLKNII